MAASRYENGMVAIMFFTWGVVFLDRMAQLYLMPYIAADLRLSDEQVGALTSAMAVCWAVSGLLFGMISDKIGRKVVLVPLTVAFSLLSGISGLARNFTQLLAVRSVMGAAEGPCWSVMNALVEQSSHPHRRGRNVGIVVSAAALIGLALAPVLTTQIAAQFGWRAAFFVAGVPGLLMAYLIARRVREPAKPRPAARTRSSGALSILGYRNVWLSALAAVGFMTWLFLQNAFAPLYITRVEHLDPRVAGFLMGAAGLGSFFIGILAPALSDRLGRRPLLIAMALLSTVLPLALLYHPLYSNLWLLAAILFLTHGGQAISALGIVLIPAESVPPALVGTAIGFVTLVGELVGGTAAPLVAGSLASVWGLQWPLWMAAAGSMLVLISASLMRRPDDTSVDRTRGSKTMTAKTEPVFVRKNPLTGEAASTTKAMTPAEACSVADKAAAAFPAWSVLAPNARRALLNKAADTLAARADEFVAAMRQEIGATEGWARFNVMLATGMLREAAALTTHIKGEVIPSDMPGCFAMALREPVGVVLGIAPWNAPVILGVRALAAALACGNCVVFKASEICPRTHSIIVEALLAAGIPEGVVGVVTNAPEDAAAVVGALIDCPVIKHVNFTGSTGVGKIIAKRAAEHLKPVLLELGGKAPLVILEDADLDEAVKAAAFGAFMNQGQICMSTERIVVVDAVADAFIDKFARKAATLKAGDPRTANTPLGAMVDARAAKKVEDLIADAVSKGAKRVAGEPGTGVLLPANVVVGVTREMRLYSEESFGPVVAVIRARDEDDAVRLANDSPYGLSAAVFTKDIPRGLRVARQIKSGICHVNGSTVHDEAQMPFGGTGASGYGRFGGTAAIHEFTQLRWITIETLPGHFPI